VSTALMLGWYLRYGLRKSTHADAHEMGGSADAATASGFLASTHTG
jgi:hypothetical protein